MSLKPGRELDALIAEKVFGYSVSEHSSENGTNIYIQKQGAPKGHYDKWLGPLPEYSSSIAAAWLVVEKLRELGYEFYVAGNNLYRVSFSRQGSDHKTMQQTASHAICLAALKAVGEPK